MAEKRKGSRVTISGLENYFATDMVRNNDLQDIRLEELHSFPNHPFRIVDDEEMNELVASVKKNGILNPVLTRKSKGNGYEIISGHRRKRAAALAGLEKIPARVLEISDEEAVLFMVDSNIQRENVLPSEKAKAYRMKYDAMKHPGGKRGGWTLKNMGETEGINWKTVQRYIWLSNLSAELLHMVDDRKLGFSAGVELSFIPEEDQKILADEIRKLRYKIGTDKAKSIRKLSKEGNLDKKTLAELLAENAGRTHGIKMSMIRKYFPEGYSDAQIVSTVIDMLENWKEKER